MSDKVVGAAKQCNVLRCIFFVLIQLPEKIASYFLWVGPLLARIIVGYTFATTGWGKLNNLPRMVELFTEWGIPFPEIMTPFVSGLEFFGGIFLILGLFTRISGGGLAVVMVVAIISAKFADIDSLETLLGFEEATYFAVFTWLAICGAGKASFDYLLVNKFCCK
jgi:putative oxidoreductase